MGAPPKDLDWSDYTNDQTETTEDVMTDAPTNEEAGMAGTKGD
jgi:hypothetical protein